MREYDAIVMVDGTHKGWVGYFLKTTKLENSRLGFLVRVFSSDGDAYELSAPRPYVKCIEPE